MDLFTIRNLLASGKTIFDLELRVTYYARVSTDKDEQVHSLGAQIQYYDAFISQNPNWTFVEGYIDEGLSGTSVAHRDAFKKMIADAQLQKFDLILTKEISRFSRNTLDSIRYTQELLRFGVGVFFQSDNIITLAPDAELRLTIMSSIAQDEVRKLSERVRFGFKRSIEKGVVLGNDCIWGYRKDKGRLVIDEGQAQIVRIIFDLYANEGLGIRRVADELSRLGYLNTRGRPFSFSTVRNVLENPKYKGYYCGNKTVKLDYRLSERKEIDPKDWVLYKDEEAVPPIVSEELWEKANRILRKRSEQYRSEQEASPNARYSYSGKLICMEHGVPYYRTKMRSGGQTKIVWQCKRYSEKGLSGCTSPIIYESDVDQIVLDCYHALTKNQVSVIAKLASIYSSVLQQSNPEEDMAKIQASIDQIQRRKDRLLDLSLSGSLSDAEFQKRNEAFNRQIDELRIAYRERRTQKDKNEELFRNIDTIKQLITNELDLSEGLNYKLADALLEKIEVYKTAERNIYDLNIIFKILSKAERYRINKRRGGTSFCSKQST